MKTFPMTAEGLLLYTAVVFLWGSFVGWAAAHYVAAKKRYDELVTSPRPPDGPFIDHAKQFGLLDEEAWFNLKAYGQDYRRVEWSKEDE